MCIRDREKRINSMLENFIEAVGSQVEIGTSFQDNLELFLKENEVSEEVVDIISSVMEEKE